MIDLKGQWHGIPMPIVIVGGTAGALVVYRFVKQYRAKAASGTDPASLGSANNNPLPGWDQLAGMIGPLGGSSPTGPLLGYDSFGVPVYGNGPATVNTGDSTKPADPAPAIPVAVDSAPIVPATPVIPSTPVTPVASAPGPLPVMTVPSAYVRPNIIPGESGSVVTETLGGGNTMTYGGSQQQVSDILSAVVNPTPVVSPPGYTPPSWGNLGGWSNYSW